MGLTFGVDPLGLAIKLPIAGRLGRARNIEPTGLPGGVEKKKGSQ